MSADLIELSIVRLFFGKDDSFNNNVLLRETYGNRYLSIIIGNYEAEIMKLIVNDELPPRPLSHQIFVNYLNLTKTTLKYAYIKKIEEGIFFSDLIFNSNEHQDEILLDSRTSDAIIMCLLTKRKIFTNQAVMNESGFLIVDNDYEFSKEKLKEYNIFEDEMSLLNLPVSELKVLLDIMIENEDYEKAAFIRDIIEKKNLK